MVTAISNMSVLSGRLLSLRDWEGTKPAESPSMSSVSLHLFQDDDDDMGGWVLHHYLCEAIVGTCWPVSPSLRLMFISCLPRMLKLFTIG